MTSRALKQAAMLAPPIRPADEQRDAAREQVAALSRRLADVETGSTKAQVNTSFDWDG